MDIVAETLSAGVLRARDVTVRGQDVFAWFESKLSASVTFVGVFANLDDAPRKNGAVAIVGSKDYVYRGSADDGEWHEFGDEGQIGALTQAVQALANSLSGYQPVGDYALKSDIPSAAEISAEIHLSDYLAAERKGFVADSTNSTASTGGNYSGFQLKLSAFAGYDITDIAFRRGAGNSETPAGTELSIIGTTAWPLSNATADNTYFVSDGTATYPQEAGGRYGFKLRRVGGVVPADGTMYFFFVNGSTGDAATARLNVYKYSTTDVAVFLHPQNGWFVEIAANARKAVGSMAYEDKDDYKPYAGTVSALSADGYALKTDIPSVAEISTEVHLSDYVLTSDISDVVDVDVPQIKKDIQQIQKSIDPTVTSFKVQTTDTYKNTGIYSAQRDDTTKPVVIDWGDGTVEEINGDVSQKTHVYESIGEFNVYVTNVKTFAASANNSTWYNTTSQNAYTLKEVVLGSSVMSIGSYAFSHCSGLTSVTIPDCVTSIGYEVFRACSGLTSVTIPDSVTSIGFSAFYGCGGLTSVTIPSSVTSIGDYAFYNCSGLTNVTIPDSVTSIGASAFKGCSGLTSILFKNYYSMPIPAGSPWGAPSTTAVETWNDASQEWVKEQNYISAVPDTYKTYDATVSSLSASGYALKAEIPSSFSTALSGRSYYYGMDLAGMLSALLDVLSAMGGRIQGAPL